MKDKLDLQLEQDWCFVYRDRANRRAEKSLKKGLRRILYIAVYVAICLIFPVANWFIITGGVLTMLPLAKNILSYLINEILVIKNTKKADNLQKQIDEIEECEVVQSILDKSTKRIEKLKNTKKTHINEFDDDHIKML